MSDEQNRRAVQFWIIIAIGAALLVAAAAITAAFVFFPKGPVPLPSITKHVEAPILVPVTGTVTLDGKPLKNAIVKFLPVAESYKRGGMSLGITDENGKYVLTYATVDGKPVMGAVVGPHQVHIQLNNLSGEQVLPARFGTSKSELKADVKKGMPPLDFALKSEPMEAPK